MLLVVEWLYPKLHKVISFFVPYAILLKWIKKGLVVFKEDLNKVEEKIKKKEEQAKLTG